MLTDQWRVLTRHRDFRRLFGGSTVSMFGSSVTRVALPLTAVAHLGASSAQMGLLNAGALLPNLLFSLPAGVWLSRLPYRRVVVLADVLQGILLAALPLLAVLGLLQMWHLIVVVLLAGTCSLFESLASESFLPTLLPREDLLAANAVRGLSSSVVTTGGAALGGALVALLTAPVALAVDALSFLVSARWKSRISTPGRDRGPFRAPTRPFHGFRTVLGHPVLRSLTVAATVGAFAGQLQAVVLVLFLVRELHLPAGVVGLVIAVAGLAGVLGALLGPGVTARLGHGRTFVLGMLLAGLAGIVLALATGPRNLVLLTVVLAQTLSGVGPSLYGMNQQTLRQTLVPPDRLPSALATWRLLVFGVQPLGALLGGTLGTLLGFRPTLVVGSVLLLLATGTALASPLRTVSLDGVETGWSPNARTPRMNG